MHARFCTSAGATANSLCQAEVGQRGIYELSGDAPVRGHVARGRSMYAYKAFGRGAARAVCRGLPRCGPALIAAPRPMTHYSPAAVVKTDSATSPSEIDLGRHGLAARWPCRRTRRRVRRIWIDASQGNKQIRAGFSSSGRAQRSLGGPIGGEAPKSANELGKRQASPDGRWQQQRRGGGGPATLHAWRIPKSTLG